MHFNTFSIQIHKACFILRKAFVHFLTFGSGEIMKNKAYICYLSPNKIDNLYSQITDFELSSIQKKHTVDLEGKTELETSSILQIIRANLSFGARKRREMLQEGNYNYIQKLSRLIDYYYKHELIVDLSKAIENKENDPNAVLYWFKGIFKCDCGQNNASKYTEEEEKEDSLYRCTRRGFEAIGRMTLLTTSIGGKKIVLSCSMRNFSDMGGHRIKVGDDFSENDKLEVVPHSGNYHFFYGMMPATFEAIVILNGQEGNTLYGSPIALINCFTPNFII